MCYSTAVYAALAALLLYRKVYNSGSIQTVDAIVSLQAGTFCVVLSNGAQ